MTTITEAVDALVAAGLVEVTEEPCCDVCDAGGSCTEAPFSVTLAGLQDAADTGLGLSENNRRVLMERA
jgi:hypothetical protein